MKKPSVSPHRKAFWQGRKLSPDEAHLSSGQTSKKLPEILRHIRRARKFGWAILPVVEGGKAPATIGGSRAASIDAKKLETHFSANSRQNNGIATGARSGFIAVDVDGPKGRVTLAALEEKNSPLPRTVKSLTPHGEHFFFKWPGYPIPNSAGKLGPGIDVRGDGGYIVGPGSRTPDGNYRFAPGHEPEDVEIVPAPPWLLELIGRGSVAREVDSAPPPRLGTNETTLGKAYAEAAFQSERERLRKAPLHQRNNTLNICSYKLGRLVARGLLDRARVITQLTQIAKAIGLEDGEIVRTVDSGLKAGLTNPARLPFEKGTSAKSASSAPSVAGDELAKRLAALGEDDIANAERFVIRYGDKVVYSETRGFLVYDGKRYRPSAHLHCVEFAKDVVMRIADETPHIGSDEARARRAKFAREARSKSAIDRLLELAKGRLIVDDKALDANPWLLNTETFTIDLLTGRYLPHDARDLITKIVPVKAKPRSKCPVFDEFIARITSGNSELAEYIQRSVGYTLTGMTTEQVLFFVYGKRGNSGKSTLMNLIREMMGDYGAHTPTETLLTKNYDNAIPADLARLEGKRMVTAIESNVNRQLDEAKIKAMTGGEPITARHLYKNFSEFAPQFKLWFAANDRPHVRATDDAIWRRIKVIPLDVKIPANEIDPDLPSKLRAELPGILSWAIRGTLMWRRTRLAEPASIIAASADWRKAVDHVRRFVTETLILGCAASEVVAAGELHSRFKMWCARNGERPMSPGRFKARIQEMFDLTHAETKRGSEWRGARWKS